MCVGDEPLTPQQPPSNPSLLAAGEMHEKPVNLSCLHKRITAKRVRIYYLKSEIEKNKK